MSHNCVDEDKNDQTKSNNSNENSDVDIESMNGQSQNHVVDDGWQLETSGQETTESRAK